ncbi:hypothetical protein AMECASPLE_028244 [Ameca splendens]|uniref:Coilin n=2 Tax=Goodeidae TaxID=28758 RepID=A0ABV0XUH6_9TELE
MAAHSNTFIRLRLFFDYPPPAAVGCRMCWLLVDPNTCRVVADLESIIRERFEFSRSSILSLFIEDCYLPHTESIYVVRDNDNIRVQVGCLAQVNGHSSCSESAKINCKKRQRDTGEVGAGDGPSVEHKKKKKKKKKLEDGMADQTNLAKVENRNKMSQTKKATKKKKKTMESVDNSHAAVPKAAAAPHKPSSPKKTPAGKIKKLKAPSSDSSSSSSDEDKTSHQKLAKKPHTTPAASKGPPNPKPTPKKSQPPSSSSSSDTDSSSDEEDSLKVPPKTQALSPKTSNSKTPQAAPAKQSEHCAQKQASSIEEPPHDKVMEPHIQNTEEEIQLVIRRPQQPTLNIPSQVHWRGLGRGKDRRWAGGDPGGRTRGGGQSNVQCFSNGTKDPSYQTDSLINKSVVLQNEEKPVPKKDYSSMPLLAGPPQVGQNIAFKLLELTENYTPEVSEYKEGKIVNFDPMTKQIELELLNTSQAPAEPGKFDLVYQNPDGSERVEYAVQRGSWVMERWESLLEPRLII